MHFHYGLGVGHVYSHEASVAEDPLSAQGANVCLESEESLRETTQWQAHADGEDEEGDHVGVEELDLFEQG